MKRVQKSGGIFNEKKLNWLNAHYIKNFSPEEFIKHAKTFIPKEWQKDEELLLRVAPLMQERLEKLSQIGELAKFIFELPSYEKELLIWKETNVSKTLYALKNIQNVLIEISDNLFTSEVINKKIEGLVNQEGRGEIFWPMRVALSGQKASPGPIELAVALGKKESMKRVSLAIEKIEGKHSLI